MLQWMGGSRRKVTTSRKSTHKRQRQYFEQKKQQKHTTGLDSNADEINAYTQYRENPKSLDILSLLNLATDARAVNSGCTIATEVPVLRVSPLNYKLSKETTLEGPVLQVSPVNYQFSKETRNKSSGQEEENVPPKKIFSNDPDKITSPHKHSSNKNGEKLDCWKTTTEKQLSFLDLLGDDGSNGNSEGSPVHESHVAFSVEGLGKMKMETPVHSPQQQCRVFFNCCPSPPKAAKRHHSSNKYMMDDLGIELNAVLHDIDMPLGRSSSELPFNSKGIRDNLCNARSNGSTVEGCRPLDSHGCRIDSFFIEDECLYNNLEDKSEYPWNGSSFPARSRFLDEDFPDERTFDESLMMDQPVEMEYSSADFFRENTYDDMRDFAFEGPYLRNKRTDGITPREFKILEKDNDILTLDGMRRPTVVDLGWGFNKSALSYFDTEDAKDNMSLLSEESSSSTAVRDEKAKHSTSNSMKFGDSLRKQGTELRRSQAKIFSTKNLYAEQTGCIDRDEIHQHTRVMNLSRTKPDCYSKEFSKVKKDLKPKYGLLFEEEYTSVDVESGLGSFDRSCLESDPTSFEWNYGCEEDLFGAYSDSKLYTKTESFSKRPRTDAAAFNCAPSFSFEKDVFQQPFNPVRYDPHIFSFTESTTSRKPDTSQVSRTEGEPLHSSHIIDSQGDAEFPVSFGQGNDGRESEFRRTDCANFPEPEKEGSVGNNGLLSENERPVDDTNSEPKETKDETPELIEKPTTRASSEVSEQTSLATKEIPDKLEICINDKKYHFDAWFPIPFQSGSKGDTESEKSSGTKGQKSSKDPSYLVMLESYVLQLLCVQKVLKEEASQQEPVKKV